MLGKAVCKQKPVSNGYRSHFREILGAAVIKVSLCLKSCKKEPLKKNELNGEGDMNRHEGGELRYTETGIPHWIAVLRRDK